VDIFWFCSVLLKKKKKKKKEEKREREDIMATQQIPKSPSTQPSQKMLRGKGRSGVEGIGEGDTGREAEPWAVSHWNNEVILVTLWP
jgi:hypothetical protein